MKKIFNNDQIREADAFTIQHEPIQSIDLMERAARGCFDWLYRKNYFHLDTIVILCGTGNNGGDGMAIARMIAQSGQPVCVYTDIQKQKSNDSEINFERIRHDKYIQLKDWEDFYVTENTLYIDAIFGTGLNKPVEGKYAPVIRELNKSGAFIVSIDVPSGLFTDRPNQENNLIIQAKHTLTFQSAKFSFLFPENEKYVGTLHVIDIGLSAEYTDKTPTNKYLIEKKDIRKIWKPSSRHAHKGHYGHVFMACGSSGMMGAAILSAEACLRSGAGKLTCFIPYEEREILLKILPSAMYLSNEDEPDFSMFQSIVCGPGLGKHYSILEKILNQKNIPKVLDADALNMIAGRKELLSLLNSNCILTPHVGEFDRLFGTHSHSIERYHKQVEVCQKSGIHILLKGHHSCLTTPEGVSYFNTTGNAGMATAGSGDVLSGMAGAFLAGNYSMEESGILAMFIHGLAGDIAANKMTIPGMISSDIIKGIPDAFRYFLTHDE